MLFWWDWCNADVWHCSWVKCLAYPVRPWDFPYKPLGWQQTYDHGRLARGLQSMALGASQRHQGAIGSAPRPRRWLALEPVQGLPRLLGGAWTWWYRVHLCCLFLVHYADFEVLVASWGPVYCTLLPVCSKQDSSTSQQWCQAPISWTGLTWSQAFTAWSSTCSGMMCGLMPCTMMEEIVVYTILCHQLQ